MMSSFNSSAQNLRVDDALLYLNNVKFSIGTDEDKFQRFMAALAGFKTGSIDINSVIKIISELFKGYPSLIQGFNMFLPAQCQLSVDNVGSGDTYKVTVATPSPSIPQNTQEQPVARQDQNSMYEHAIEFVRRVKTRFSTNVEIYNKFVEALKNYKRRNTEGQPMTDGEIYIEVAQLFRHNRDLLAEFMEFIPMFAVPGPKRMKMIEEAVCKLNPHKEEEAEEPQSFPKKRKYTSSCDVTYSEAAKYATLKDYAFFDEIRKALIKYPDVYMNFLQVLNLFNKGLVTKKELIQLVQPFLIQFPQIFKWFKDFVANTEFDSEHSNVDIITNHVQQKRPEGEAAMKIDYTASKRLGVSYCAVPDTYIPAKCSGRTALCHEVLNDKWVSFPSWAEESTFVTGKKTQFEEYIYRCEDERFELDVAIETNGSTLRVLESVQKKILRLPPDEANNYKLDDTLGGNSPTIHLRSIKRVYGDKAGDILDGLKNSPLVAIPVIIRRLHAKENEWREAQKEFNKLWREQNEKYYYKSLDVQGLTFKTNDLKYLKSKSLFNEIEAVCEERQGKYEGSNLEMALTDSPHLVFSYNNKTVLHDACNLMLYFVQSMPTATDEEKAKIRALLRYTVCDLFMYDRLETTAEEESEILEEIPEPMPDSGPRCTLDDTAYPPDEHYVLFMTNSNWYLFLRLHHILCDRLSRILAQAHILIAEELEKQDDRQDPATTLRLKPKLDYSVEEYYPTLLSLTKDLLDGKIENVAFDDTIRDMFGIHAYITSTFDKVIAYAVRQLYLIVTNEIPLKCLSEFRRELPMGGAGGSLRNSRLRKAREIYYQNRIEYLLAEENCFKIYIYKVDGKITFELLEYESDESKSATEAERHAMYVDKYISEIRNSGIEDSLILWSGPRFLPRNIAAWKRINVNGLKPEIREYGEGPERMTTHHPNPNLIIEEDLQCIIGKNCKMIYIANKENLIYKKGCLKKARKTHKELTLKKRSIFKAWHEAWVRRYVSDRHYRNFNDWMMGKKNDFMPSVMKVKVENRFSRPPYASINRYSVTYLP